MQVLQPPDVFFVVLFSILATVTVIRVWIEFAPRLVIGDKGRETIGKTMWALIGAAAGVGGTVLVTKFYEEPLAARQQEAAEQRFLQADAASDRLASLEGRIWMCSAAPDSDLVDRIENLRDQLAAGDIEEVDGQLPGLNEQVKNFCEDVQPDPLPSVTSPLERLLSLLAATLGIGAGIIRLGVLPRRGGTEEEDQQEVETSRDSASRRRKRE
ncbi:MAG: hypothetical protein ACRBK7_29855 [Acidimicrobiales bacterium]